MTSESNVVRWATAISTHRENGKKIFFRFAQELRPQFDKASQPARIIILWEYESETGQPSTDEHNQMNIFEDVLGPLLFKDEFATLALVSTGENAREWNYYAGSEDEFFARLDEAIGPQIFPIEIYVETDPTWKYYETFLTGKLQIQ
jgi:Family of unknown function (DUF695)